MALERLHILIKGQVQGVGFRPHVYRTATKLGLTGWVQNNASGVSIQIQGQTVSQFITVLTSQIPPLAQITDMQTTPMPVIADECSFDIIDSEPGNAQTIISPDTSICSDCLSELFDPKSRYYQYPFLNCTHCGPRLTITRKLPYDRQQTSMAGFPLCEACRHDYADPTNRRYHAQPTACAQCGPQLSLPIKDIAKRIRQGEIIALKGLGGYQLICDARNDTTVVNLRMRKNRDAKPFALMVLNGASAKLLVEVNQPEEVCLHSPARPIVLLRKKESTLPESIAPHLSSYGVMLPATPLHYLLFHALAGVPDGFDWLDDIQPMVLVVTSANTGGHPLVIEDDRARSELKTIADTIVSYNRDIVSRADDSVVQIVHHTPMYIRRSRGYVPTPIQLAHSIPPTLALGGHLKNTFCITRGDEAFVSQHIGSLNNQATIEFFHETLSYLLSFLNVTPERIAHDLHPDFYTSRFAQLDGVSSVPIQHHHAHLASVVAEHHLQQPVLGLALDGYGYGLRGESWGGELFVLENTQFQRIGSFYPFPQPGGDMAAREPWRMAAAVLHHLGRAHEISTRYSQHAHASLIQQLLDKKIHCPLTSSCGRLFDAASALLGVQAVSQYEGQSAMRLESLVTHSQSIPNGWRIHDHYFDMTPTLEVLADLEDPILGANLFHGTLIDGLAAWVKASARDTGINDVVFSGGCFLNKILTEGLIKALTASGIKTFLPRILPPNDGGLSLGQAWIAGNMQ